MEKYKNKLYWLTCTLLFLLSTAALASNHSLSTSVYIQNNLVVAQDAEMILMAKKVAPGVKKSNIKAKRNSARAVGKAKMKRSGMKTVSKFKQKRKAALSKNKRKGIRQAKYKKSRLGKNNRPLSQKKVNPKKAVTNSFRDIKKNNTYKHAKQKNSGAQTAPAYLKTKISGKLGKKIPGPRLPPKEIASTFKFGKYTNRKLTKDTLYYKYHGVNNRTGKKYTWVTNKKYSSEKQLRADLAIRKEWTKKTGGITHVTAFKVPKGTWVSEGHAASQGKKYPGGGFQAVISNVPKSWIVNTSKVFNK